MSLIQEGQSERRGFVSRTWYNFRKSLGEFLIEPLEDPNAFKGIDLKNKTRALIDQNHPETKEEVQKP